MEDIQASPAIGKFIENVAEDHGISNYELTSVTTNQKGEGFLGKIYMVTLKDTTENEELNIVIKAAFIEEKIREMAPIRLAFQNEIYFYSNVYPEYQQLEKEHELVPNLEIVPRCLKVSLKNLEEMLALENLKTLGYKLFNKKSILDHNHIKLIFETYGRFHAYSYAMRDQKPEEYLKITEGLHNIFAEFAKTTFFADHLKAVNEIVEKCLIPGEDDEVIEKYKKYSGYNTADFFDKVTKETDEYSAILHGDCWSNNMLFKYQGQIPTEIKLIDWQLVKLGSPVCDLSYFLYSGASKESFDNLDDYMKIYYNTFSSFIRKLKSDPKTLYPFAVLKEHWRKYSKFGMIMAFDLIKLKLTDKEDLVDFTDGLDMSELVAKVAESKCNEDDYNKRIRDLLCHMSEIGAL